MEWIKTEEKLPEVGQQIEMTCTHWEADWVGQFEYPYIEKGSFDEFGNFWNFEGCRLYNPSYWRPYQPERSKREDLPKWACRAVMMPNGLCHFEDGTIIDSQQPIDEGCGALNSMET
jgi:hypothetical protein